MTVFDVNGTISGKLCQRISCKVSDWLIQTVIFVTVGSCCTFAELTKSASLACNPNHYWLLDMTTIIFRNVKLIVHATSVDSEGWLGSALFWPFHLHPLFPFFYPLISIPMIGTFFIRCLHSIVWFWPQKNSFGSFSNWIKIELKSKETRNRVSFDFNSIGKWSKWILFLI